MKIVRKGLCAFLREDGFCFVHRKACRFEHDYAPCPDAVRRAGHAPEGGRNAVVAGRVGHAVRFWMSPRMARVEDEVPGWIVYKTCKRKGRYTTENEASKAARRMEMRFGLKMRAYYCKFCEGWHLTKKQLPMGDLFSALLAQVDTGRCA